MNETVKKAYLGIVNAYENAKWVITNIVKEHGGILRLPQDSDKTTIYCYLVYESEPIPIQAIAYDEGEGLMVLTNDELKNYEYDNGYEFEYFYDFEGEDKEHYEAATKDLTYFRELDDSNTNVHDTIFSILTGISDYLA